MSLLHSMQQLLYSLHCYTKVMSFVFRKITVAEKQLLSKQNACAQTIYAC